MKILFINSVCGFGSTGKIVTEVAEKFIKEGSECRIAYGRYSAPEQYESISYKIGNKISVILNAIKARLFDNEAFNATRQTKKFIKWADKYDPDILWLHNLHGYYINIDLLFKWIKSRPQMQVKWTLHDCWAFTGHCSHFAYEGCNKWQSLCETCPQKNSYPKSIFKDNSRENFQKKKQSFTGVHNMTLITPSHWLEGLVKQSFLQEYPIEVVYNTINTQIFKPTPSTFRKDYGLENKIILLGVANVWNDRKGLQDFIKLSQCLDERYVIVMVGLNKKQITKLPKNIIAIERTSNARELAQIYTVADLFLNLTYEDNYPTVNLEAKSCGTTVITYNTGGSVESVDPLNIVEQGNLEDLINVIEKKLKV